MSVARVFPIAAVTKLACAVTAYERERAAGATVAMALTLAPLSACLHTGEETLEQQLASARVSFAFCNSTTRGGPGG